MPNHQSFCYASGPDFVTESWDLEIFGAGPTWTQAPRDPRRTRGPGPGPRNYFEKPGAGTVTVQSQCGNPGPRPGPDGRGSKTDLDPNIPFRIPCPLLSQVSDFEFDIHIIIYNIHIHTNQSLFVQLFEKNNVSKLSHNLWEYVAPSENLQVQLNAPSKKNRRKTHRIRVFRIFLLCSSLHPLMGSLWAPYRAL